MDVRALSRRLFELLDLATLPVGVSFREDGLPCEVEVRRRYSFCQMVYLARSQGRTMGVDEKTIQCPLALASLGFADPPDWMVGTGYYGRQTESILAELPHFELGRYRSLVVTPLLLLRETSDVVLVVGTASQISLLLNSWNFVTGRRLQVVSGSVATMCGDALVQPHLSGEPSVGTICAGSRAFGRLRDGELIFGSPGSLLGDLVCGLEELDGSGFVCTRKTCRH